MRRPGFAKSLRENDWVRVVEAAPEDIDSWLNLAGEVEHLFGPMVDQPEFHRALLRNLARSTARHDGANKFSEDAGSAFIDRQWGRWTTGEGLSLAMVEARTGTAAGLMCLLHRQQPGVIGVGYWMVASRRKKGLTLASLVLLSRWALHLSAVDRLEALVDPGNEASVRVLNGAGFRQEGRLRSYMEFEGHRGDALLYALLESDLDPPTSVVGGND